MSNEGTMRVQAQLKELSTCPKRNKFSTSTKNYNSLTIVLNTRIGRGAGAPTRHGSTLVKDSRKIPSLARIYMSEASRGVL